MSCNHDNTTISCLEAYEEMKRLLSQEGKTYIRNYSCQIQMGGDPPSSESTYKNAYTVQTELFPVEALDVYSAYNLEETIQEDDRQKYFSAHRGGSQGDYRQGMKQKITNVCDSLHKFPKSKRAVITIPNTSFPHHSSDDDAKCMREIHFYLDEDGHGILLLNATVLMRAQAAEIFPKNIHFIGSLMDRVVAGLSKENVDEANGDTHGSHQKSKVNLGVLYYLATTLVSVRED